MHKHRKAAAVAAALVGIGLLGTGPAYAGGGKDGDNHRRAQSHRVEAPQQQSSRQAPQPQQWSGDRRHHKSHGHRRVEIRQSTSCRTHEANVDVLGNVSILDGLLGNAGGGKRHHHHPDGQSTGIGTTEGCNNVFRG
ncbi:hypothetical protein [Streptomyces sp. NBRC 110611]|uniref:hypothetical protein n=1 Tax=Streptomyces sp. NBRC 110611 TaxID=1621259 RepID=UPI00082D6EF7|nr:hypothetical protein [Streptomyces sp. NBRC 110611]